MQAACLNRGYNHLETIVFMKPRIAQKLFACHTWHIYNTPTNASQSMLGVQVSLAPSGETPNNWISIHPFANSKKL